MRSHGFIRCALLFVSVPAAAQWGNRVALYGDVNLFQADVGKSFAQAQILTSMPNVRLDYVPDDDKKCMQGAEAHESRDRNPDYVTVCSQLRYWTANYAQNLFVM